VTGKVTVGAGHRHGLSTYGFKWLQKGTEAPPRLRSSMSMATFTIRGLPVNVVAAPQHNATQRIRCERNLRHSYFYTGGLCALRLIEGVLQQEQEKQQQQQGSRRYHTLPAVCNRAFFNLSPITAKLTSLSYGHASKSVVYLFLCQPSQLP